MSSTGHGITLKQNDVAHSSGSDHKRKSKKAGAEHSLHFHSLLCSSLLFQWKHKNNELNSLSPILEHKWAWPFMQPVDIKGLGLHKVIENPMDFSTIKNQMEAKDGTGYKNVRAICADEKRCEEEEAEAQLNMQLVRGSSHAEMLQAISNEIPYSFQFYEVDTHLEQLRDTVIRKCRKMSTEEKRNPGTAIARLSPEDLTVGGGSEAKSTDLKETYLSESADGSLMIPQDECKRVSTERQNIRLDVSAGFHNAIKDVTNKLEEQKNECLSQLKENEMSIDKLKQFADQYDLAEQQFEQKIRLKQKTLELELADLKIKQHEERLIQEQVLCAYVICLGWLTPDFGKEVLSEARTVEETTGEDEEPERKARIVVPTGEDEESEIKARIVVPIFRTFRLPKEISMENKDIYLETSKAERSMWLMKCPRLVSRSLQRPQPSSSSSSASASPSHAVAKVILSIDPRVSSDDNDSSSPQFTMDLVGTETGDVPKSYSMDMTKDFVPMSVFSQTSQGKLAVEGKILNKFDMRPHDENIENYGKLCRERTNKSMNKSRQIQVIDNDNGSHMRPMPGMIIAAVFNEKKKAPAKTLDTKRTRRDRGEMEDIMFKLFERQTNWTLRQLIQETDQPEQFLKDILKDLCIYNNKGTNQGSYELKPEYKKATDGTNS
ncbi:Transcription initiation factor IIF isoform 3 [Hibiscus syriacus]|uniref:Transcription initiation factor IIF isoform 3 n=2 Tax=Hibiscus syriacus TaxID=106335 RepID=A0A6A3BLU5_HIBSY|nr:Transcription initiation factor IIF isoform 3 [Hibiscus syriacus]